MGAAMGAWAGVLVVAVLVRAGALSRRRRLASVRLPAGVGRPGVEASAYFSSRWSAVHHRLLGGRSGTVDRQLPDAVEHVARSLRSGLPLRDAVASAAAGVDPPLAGHLLLLARDLEVGHPLALAASAWAERVDRPGATLTAAALRLGSESGGSRSRALDRVARSLRERLGIQREVVALSAQARVSAVVMGVGPVAFALLTSAVDQGSARILLATPLGWGCLAGALLLDAAAVVWMARLVRSPGS